MRWLGYSKYRVLADRHVSHRLVTPNIQYWLIDMSAVAWLHQIFSTDRHVSHRLVTPNIHYWLIDMSAIAWLLQIFSTG